MAVPTSFSASSGLPGFLDGASPVIQPSAITVAPFGLATFLAWIAVPIGSSIDWNEYGLATALVVAVFVLPFTRMRPRRLGTAPLALLYLLAVALLRDSAGGFSSGVAIVSLVPVFYVALYRGRTALAVVIAGVAAFYLVPIIAIGSPDYPSAQYRTALLAVTISAIIGLTTQKLVAQTRRSAQEAQERERMLADIGDLVRRLLGTPDARQEICEAARTIGDAAFATLYEVESPSVEFSVTARAGADVRFAEADVVGVAMRRSIESHYPVLLDRDLKRSLGLELWEQAGRPIAISCQPLLRDDDAIGVLVVGWCDEGGIEASRVTLITLLAHEATSVIDRADLLQRLERTAGTDPLTGLPNRRGWDIELERVVDEEAPFSIAILDLDHFKRYNDTHGHLAGDRLLRATTAIWRDQLRDGDTLARLGGEEFGLLLRGCDIPTAREVVDRLRAATDGGQTCSAGLAVRSPGESGTDVVRRADRALYDAKGAGRDRTCV
jgi:diguanylate cyclase (GGDEF)-like protein